MDNTAGPYYPGTGTDEGGPVAWTNPSYVGATGSNYAEASYFISGFSGSDSNALAATDFAFDIPSTGVIDGIVVTLNTYGDQAEYASVQLLKAGSPVGSGMAGGIYVPGSVGTQTFGSSTNLWGTTWTPAQVNASNFGVEFIFSPTFDPADTHVYANACTITIYWHTAPTTIPRTTYHLYKVYDNLTGKYLGNLPDVSSDLLISQDINTGGTNITVSCAVSADTSGLPTSVYTDESGTPYTDESGTYDYVTEGVEPYTGIGTSSALIRNGNHVKVWKYDYWHPNGICMFSGSMERGSDNFGGDTGDDNVVLLIYSDGQDLSSHIIKAGTSSYTADQAQTNQDQVASVYWTSGKLDNWNYYGQTWTVGSGVTNLGAINVLLNGTANVTVSVYTNPSVETLLTTATQEVSVGSPTVTTFTFSSHIPVVAGRQYFFTVTVDNGDSIWVYYQDGTPYAGGTMYNNNFTGTSGGSWYAYPSGCSLYFETYSTTGATVANFTNLDPTTGMLQTFFNDYITEGGAIGIGNIQATGLSLSYGFNTNTTYDGLNAMITISPNGFYYYVDLGYNLLDFQQASTTADFTLIKGVHINKLTIVRTTEYVINAVYVVGGPDPDNPGYNIYTYDYDLDSVARYGLRLQIHTDNNIPDAATAHQVGQNIISTNKDEQYQTKVTILASTMDITLLTPGKIIAFTGFNTYVDGLLAQNVHRDYATEQVTLTLGILPKRTTVSVETLVKGLTALSTINNPAVAD